MRPALRVMSRSGGSVLSATGSRARPVNRDKTISFIFFFFFFNDELLGREWAGEGA